MEMRNIRSVGIVVPVYNEAQGLLQFHQRLMAVLDRLPCQVNVWYVDDGSYDGTGVIIEGLIAADNRIHLIELSRNFGHQAALTAGLDHAWGDVVITLDGDGQHPPELIPEMLRLYQEGSDVVLTRRYATQGRWFLKRVIGKAFYWFFNRIAQTNIIPESSDFRLLSHDALMALRRLPEYHRFLRGMVSWLGFRQAILEFQEPPRIAGRPRYSVRKLMDLALSGIFSFSLIPLHIALALGGLLILLAVAEVAYTLYLILVGRRSELPPGWTSLMFFLLAIGGVQLVTLGIIGHYVGLIFQEVKRRPVYIIRRQVNALEASTQDRHH